MADLTKYTAITNGTIISAIISYFTKRKTKKIVSLASSFIFIIIVFTTFLAFTPSLNPSSPWFTYTLSTTTITTTSSTFVPYSSQSNSVTNNDGEKPLIADNTDVWKPINNRLQVPVLNQTVDRNKISPKSGHDKVGVLEKDNSTLLHYVNKTVDNNRIPTKPFTWYDKGSSYFNQNRTESEKFHEKVGSLKGNGTIIGITNSGKNVTAYGEKVTGENITSSVVTTKQDSGTNVVDKKHGNGTHVKKKKRENGTNFAMKKKQDNGTHVAKEKQGNDDLIKDLVNCNLFNGDWVKDNSYPLYKQGSCSLIDEQFNCFLNGRPDIEYQKLKWKPKGCTLPRLDGSYMLELLRGKRLVFVGDSLNRNMWESLVCILKNSVKDQKNVYEQKGSYKFRTQASFSFIFEDYKAMVEFYVSPFLVEQWESTDKNGTTKGTLRLDLISSLTTKYRDADILVFNTAHWWNPDKTYSGKNYYQEGSNLYSELNFLEAFRKGLTTWGRWVDANVNPKKSLVFFRGLSAVHYSGGRWNSGGQCDIETEPIKEDRYLTQYPPKVRVLEKVLRGMKTHVTYLNVTKMTDYRKDGHPSIYRYQNHSGEETRLRSRIHQDCSHWCLPGVPDAWNEILYAQLLVKLYHNSINNTEY